MTPEDRETLERLAAGFERSAEMFRSTHPNAAGERAVAKALRAALVEHTCGTCRHYIAGQCDNDQQLQSTLSYMEPDDGCLKGWAPKEGA